jgi:hypothetical protein
MTPAAQRKFNIAAGTVSLLFGMAAWGAAIHVALTPAAPRPAPVSLAPIVDLASCAQAFSSMGMPAEVKAGNRVEVYLRSDLAGVDVNKLLQDASLGIAACRLELQRFCMGRGCELPGLSMQLVDSSRDRSAAPPTAAPAPRPAPGPTASPPKGPAPAPKN